MKRTIVASALVLGLAACNAKKESEVPPKDPVRSDADAPAHEYNPTYKLEILVMESMPEQYALHWTAEVNTGGWSMTTDGVEVADGVATIRITLTAPSTDTMVTQAFETLEGRHQAGTTRIERAELHVRRVVEGAAPAAADYTVQAKAGG
mgnify:CR=1 FL=1